jgi:ferredoxin
MADRQPDGVTESLLVRVHPGLCEAWGQCHRWAPEIYPLDDEGYIDIHVLEVPPELAVTAWRGARACPIQAITIVDVVRRPEHQPTETDDGQVASEQATSDA